MTEYIAHNDRSTDESRIAYYHRLLGGGIPPFYVSGRHLPLD